MKQALIVTSIAKPNKILATLAQGSVEYQFDFILIGDAASPPDFHLPGCRFYGLQEQFGTGLQFAERCPQRHYARKNIGYLLAAREGAQIIVETDDDNLPMDSFWQPRQRCVHAAVLSHSGWVNVYRYFSDQLIWPRGFALSQLQQTVPAYETLAVKTIDAPIQQGLADANPDVDAIYRLILPLPQHFNPHPPIALGRKTWCPFNSQNTTWFREAFALLYLPAFCSFRMTDIWRSFVAQRIAWENDWHILFHAPTVWQERNDHNLMRDFNDEIVGYQYNERICEVLENLPLKSGAKHLADNLRICYRALIEQNWIGSQELALLDAWIEDLPEDLK